VYKLFCVSMGYLPMMFFNRPERLYQSPISDCTRHNPEPTSIHHQQPGKITTPTAIPLLFTQNNTQPRTNHSILTKTPLPFALHPSHSSLLPPPPASAQHTISDTVTDIEVIQPTYIHNDIIYIHTYYPY
jgi:hypothetical protein